MTSPPTFAFGLISDVQYADIDDGLDHKEKMQRHYRGALDVLTRAVQYFNTYPVPLAFVAQLGDLIDGKNAPHNSETALARALAVIERCTVPFVNLIGNHELYNFDRETLARRLGTRPAGRPVEFYASQPAAGWRMLVLDAFQEAVIGHPPGEPRRDKAVTFLRAKRTECGRPADADPDDWFAGLSGEQRRFNPYNGAFGSRQLQWLRSQLGSAREAGDRVLILSHVVLHAGACHGTTMAWDYLEALEVIGAHAGVVAAVLCGHEHKGGYHYDAPSKVHHITVASPLNEGASGEAYGAILIRESSLELHSPNLPSIVKAADLAKMIAAGGRQGANAIALPLEPPPRAM